MATEGETINYTYTTKIEEEKRGGGAVARYVIVEVGNNLGLPTYTDKVNYNPDLGYDEKGAVTITEQKFKQNPPKIEGKDYEGQTYPKEGSEVIFVEDEDPIPYEFECGQVVDKTTRETLTGVKIKDLNGKESRSKSKGNFKIKGEYLSFEIQKLILNKKGYNATTFPISMEDGSILKFWNIIELSPSKGDASSSIMKAKKTSFKERERMSEEEKKAFIKKMKKKIIHQVKTILIPMIINKLLCEPFGVCDPIGLLEDVKKIIKDIKDREKKEERKKRREEKEKGKEEEVDYDNIYANDPNYIENKRRILEGRTDLLPVPTPGYPSEDELKENLMEEGIVQSFTYKPDESSIYKDLIGGMDLGEIPQEIPDYPTDGDIIPTTPGFDPVIIDLEEIPDINIKKEKQKRIKKIRVKKTRYKKHYNAQKIRRNSANKTMRLHKRNPIGR